MNSWNNPDIKENNIFRNFLNVVRYLYRTPLNMFDDQCDIYNLPPENIGVMDLVDRKINFEGIEGHGY